MHDKLHNQQLSENIRTQWTNEKESFPYIKYQVLFLKKKEWLNTVSAEDQHNSSAQHRYTERGLQHSNDFFHNEIRMVQSLTTFKQRKIKCTWSQSMHACIVTFRLNRHSSLHYRVVCLSLIWCLKILD